VICQHPVSTFGTWVLTHPLPLCWTTTWSRVYGLLCSIVCPHRYVEEQTSTTTRSSICVGRVIQVRRLIETDNTDTGPVGRIYLWKEWNTLTVVYVSSTETLMFPSTFSLSVSSLFWKFVLSFQNKNVLVQ
jgi:hypothetical protein